MYVIFRGVFSYVGDLEQVGIVRIQTPEVVIFNTYINDYIFLNLQ